MEFLKEILGDMYADFTKAVKAYKKKGGVVEIADISNGKYVAKDVHDDVLARLETAENLKAQLENDLSIATQKYDTDTGKLKKDIDDIKFSFALDNAIMAKSPKNLRAVKALIDTEGLSLKDGVIEGLDIQLEKICAENDYLFDTVRGGTGMRISGGAPSAFDAFSESARKSAGM